MPKVQNNHIKDYNRAIDYIEEKIKNSEEITNEGIAREFGFEQHYFARFFQKYAKMTIQEYVKKRKMSHALIDLTRTDDSIANLAEKYLYSADGFTKAFRDIFGTPPLKAKKIIKESSSDSDSNYFDFFTNREFIEDYSDYIEEPKDFKIIDGEKMKFIGVSNIAYVIDEKAFEDFDLTSTIYENGKCFNLNYYEDGKYCEYNSYSASYYTPFCEKRKNSEIINIPKRKWLVLSAKETEMGCTLSALSTYARYEWIQKHSEYEIEDGYEIGFVSECLSNLGIDVEDVYELWVPIKEK